MKRERLEIIKDILKIIQENKNNIRVTPLLRKSNLSSERFYKYLDELTKKELIIKKTNKQNNSLLSLTQKGQEFIGKYQAIKNFINEFDL